jgi:putative PIG3 family NAD(P)H quinone oxidoreductase
MQVITCKSFGEPDVLCIENVPVPTPLPHQLLVRVKATALNRADILQRRGKYAPPMGESNVFGLEIAGVVEERGQNVTDFKIGDRVFGLVGSGGYAEHCIIDSQMAWPIPTNLSFVEAAAIPEAFLTANEALFTLGNLQSNESVLVHAGASGVGTAAIQLAKNNGATVFTTVGHVEKIVKVKKLGADKIIHYKEEDFAIEIEKQQGVDVIIDFIGARYFESHLAILKPSGRLICVGMMGGAKTNIDLNVIIKKQLQIKGLIMRARSIEDKRKISQHFAKTGLSLLATGKIHPVVDRIFPFHEVKAAHSYMESNVNVGKIILQIAE